MEKVETHVFRHDPVVTKTVACICGRPLSDPVHVPEIKRVTYGTARPDYFGRPR